MPPMCRVLASKLMRTPRPAKFGTAKISSPAISATLQENIHDIAVLIERRT